MSAPSNPLPIGLVLRTVRDHGMNALEELIRQGNHEGRVVKKFESLAERGYLDYGTTAKRPWLDTRGREWLKRNPR